TLSSCIQDTSVNTVIGFALDGFPITGPKVGDGNILTTSDRDECHGVTSTITLDGKQVETHHYVMSQDFPYSASCFRAQATRPPGQPAGQQGGAGQGAPPGQGGGGAGGPPGGPPRRSGGTGARGGDSRAEPRYVRPGWFTRHVGNPAVALLTRAGISVWGSRELRVRGRTSGEWRTTPVNLLAYEGVRYLVAPRGVTQWVRNLRVAGEGELRV